MIINAVMIMMVHLSFHRIFVISSQTERRQQCDANVHFVRELMHLDSSSQLSRQAVSNFRP